MNIVAQILFFLIYLNCIIIFVSASGSKRAIQFEALPLHVKEFLFQYGYLHPGYTITDEHVKKALREYQHMMRVPITGVADADTILMMKTPRCGHKDLAVSVNEPQKEDFSTEAGLEDRLRKWDLTWKITKYTKDFPEMAQRNMLKQAYEQWSNVSRLNFREVHSSYFFSDHDFSIGFYVGNHFDDDPFYKNSTTLAHGFFPETEYAGKLHFNDWYTWMDRYPTIEETTADKRSWYILPVAIHEIGHTLGLQHSNDPESIMWPVDHRRTTLSPDDIKGIQAIYGPPEFEDVCSKPHDTAGLYCDMYDEDPDEYHVYRYCKAPLPLDNTRNCGCKGKCQNLESQIENYDPLNRVCRCEKTSTILYQGKGTWSAWETIRSCPSYYTGSCSDVDKITRFQRRRCIKDGNDKPCQGPSFKIKTCPGVSCKADYAPSWGSWNEFSCENGDNGTYHCGHRGVMARSRSCKRGYTNVSTSECAGSPLEVIAINCEDECYLDWKLFKTNKCTEDFCNKGGECSPDYNYQRYCECTDGFTGDHCEFCSATTCKHGSCMKNGTYSYCKCDYGYRKQDCSEKDPCPDTCFNGGTCIQKESIDDWTKTRYCYCTHGFTGSQCEKRVLDKYGNTVLDCGCKTGETCEKLEYEDEYRCKRDWTGTDTNYHGGTNYGDNSQKTDNVGEYVGYGIGGFFLITVVILCVAVGSKRKGSRRNRRYQRMENEPSPQGGAVATNMRPRPVIVGQVLGGQGRSGTGIIPPVQARPAYPISPVYFPTHTSQIGANPCPPPCYRDVVGAAPISDPTQNQILDPKALVNGASPPGREMIRLPCSISQAPTTSRPISSNAGTVPKSPKECPTSEQVVSSTLPTQLPELRPHLQQNGRDVRVQSRTDAHIDFYDLVNDQPVA